MIKQPNIFLLKLQKTKFNKIVADGGCTEKWGKEKTRWLKVKEKHCHICTHKPNWLIHISEF